MSCRLSGQRPSSKPAQGKRGLRQAEASDFGELRRAEPSAALGSQRIKLSPAPTGRNKFFPYKLRIGPPQKGLIGMFFVHPGGRSFGSTELDEVLASPGLACRRAFGPLECRAL